MQNKTELSLGKYLEILSKKYPEETLATIEYNLDAEKRYAEKIYKNNVKCKICDNYGERIKCNKCETNHLLCNSCFVKISSMHDFYFKKMVRVNEKYETKATKIDIVE